MYILYIFMANAVGASREIVNKESIYKGYLNGIGGSKGR